MLQSGQKNGFAVCDMARRAWLFQAVVEQISFFRLVILSM